MDNIKNFKGKDQKSSNDFEMENVEQIKFHAIGSKSVINANEVLEQVNSLNNPSLKPVGTGNNVQVNIIEENVQINGNEENIRININPFAQYHNNIIAVNVIINEDVIVDGGGLVGGGPIGVNNSDKRNESHSDREDSNVNQKIDDIVSQQDHIINKIVQENYSQIVKYSQYIYIALFIGSAISLSIGSIATKLGVTQASTIGVIIQTFSFALFVVYVAGFLSFTL
jgi:hypothetical protein